jgi:2-aminoadipate transaminase
MGANTNHKDHAHFSELGRRIEAPPISWLMEQKLKYPDLISLAAGFTDGPSLPVKEAQKIFSKLTKSNKRATECLQYGVGAGRDRLRQQTAQHVAELDEANTQHPCYQPDRVIMTHGSQQFLYLLTEALCDKGDIVLVEAPTYFVYLGILQSFGTKTRSISMESDGLSLESLKKTLERLRLSGDIKKVKMLYLVSYFQNPTGITTSIEKKKAILRLVKSYEKYAGHPIYILEDAAYRELKFPSTPETPSCLTLPGARQRVIYSGTYSKPFATGIRVGFGFLPEPLLTVVMRIKGNHDFGTANLLQSVIEEALDSGLYQSHVTQLQSRYQSKAKHMQKCIQRSFPDKIKWDVPAGGLYFWAMAPKTISTGPQSPLFKKALKERIMYVPGVYTFANDVNTRNYDNAMRISFGNASLLDIKQGIERLGNALKTQMTKNKKGRP